MGAGTRAQRLSLSTRFVPFLHDLVGLRGALPRVLANLLGLDNSSRCSGGYNGGDSAMVTLKLGKHRVEVYGAVDELPVVRFHKYQKLMLIDAGIGADITALDQRLEKTRRYLMAGKGEDAKKELANLRQCVYFIQTGLSPRHRAFAALVHRVDGETFEDASDTAIGRILELLSDVAVGDLDGQLMSVKKKSEGELTLYFPKVFESPETKEWYDLLKRRTATQLSLLAQGVNPEGNEEIERLTTLMMTLAPAKVFDGPEGEEVKADRNFEDVCLVLSEQLHIQPKTMTVFEYYSAYDFAQRRAKEAENAQKRLKSAR